MSVFKLARKKSQFRSQYRREYRVWFSVHTQPYNLKECFLMSVCLGLEEFKLES